MARYILWLAILCHVTAAAADPSEVPSPVPPAGAERVAQVAPPTDLTPPPGAGVTFKILRPGTAAPPPSHDDDVVTTSTAWSRSGRTLESAAGRTQLLTSDDSVVDAQLTAMHPGEKRRIWIPARMATTKADEVWDVELTAIQRHVAVLPRGLRLAVANKTLEVRRGTQRAELASASSIHESTLDATTQTLTVDYEDTCNFTRTAAWPLVRLEAMIESTAAAARVAKHDDLGAAAGFARAAALDPSWDDPLYRGAAAQLRAHDAPAAVQTLARRLAADPIGVYLHVASDPALSALITQPALRAVESRRAGSVAVTGQGIQGEVAVSPDRKLLAVVVTENTYAASWFSRHIDVIAVADGRMVGTLPLVDWREASGDCYDATCDPLLAGAKPAVARRAQRAQAVLRALGFVKATTEPGQTDNTGDPRVKFPRAKLALEANDSEVRVVRGAAVLTTLPNDRTRDTAYVEETHTLLVWSNGHQSEAGCNTGPTAWVTAIPVPPATRATP